MADYSKAHFANAISTKDDDLSTIAVLTTANAHHFTLMRFSRVFLRALINKSNATAAFQVYGAKQHGLTWQLFERAAYATATGPVDVATIDVGHEVWGCDPNCRFEEDFAFEVPEAEMRAQAANYATDPYGFWDFKFEPRVGPEWRDSLEFAEISALLDAVDLYRGSIAHKAPKATPH